MCVFVYKMYREILKGARGVAFAAVETENWKESFMNGLAVFFSSSSSSTVWME